jgi:hypothetical protein
LALDGIFVVVRHGTLGTRLDPLNGEPHSLTGPMPLLRQLALSTFQIMPHECSSLNDPDRRWRVRFFDREAALKRRAHSPFVPFFDIAGHLLQSSSPSRHTRRRGRVLILSQSGERPKRRVKSLLGLQHEPSALLIVEIKLRHGGGFGRLLFGRLDGPEVLPALPDDRDAPASRRCFSVGVWSRGARFVACCPGCCP